jgi:hypothetical protein
VGDLTVEIGSSLTGLSLLLPLGLLGSILAVGSVAIVRFRAPNGVGTWMAAVAGGYVVYLVCGLAAAEVLGAFDALTRTPLACWWMAYVIGTFSVAALLSPARRRSGSLRLRPSLVVVGAVVVFAVVLGFLLWLGTVAAPNNLDAMNYHLPRAAEWATNHNVNNYPTNIAKQLYNGRLAEYFQTQILILDGTDRLVFMPQFVAYAVSSVLVAGLARQLGGGRRAALWGLLLAATLPLAILQSTTAQTDLVVASIVMATYYLSVVWWNQDHFHVTLLFLIALSAGLAILTKEDAALTLAPLAVVMMIEAVHNHWTTAPAFGWTAVALVLCVVVTLPMGLRNWQLYGNPGGPSGGVDISSIQPAGIATAAGESLLLNLDTLTYGGNIHIFHFESSLGRLLGWNHPDLNVAYSEPDENYFPVWPVLEPAPSEDGSGDLVAFVAVLGALLLLVSAQVRSRIRPSARNLVLLVAAGGASLALILLTLKWQPWGARFQLMALYPLLACVAVVFAAVRGKVLVIALITVVVGLTLVVTPFALLKDAGKPVISGSEDYLGRTRDAQYFRWCPGLEAPYTAAVNEVFRQHQMSLGYVSKEDDFEYPLWALMSERARGAPVHVVPLEIQHEAGDLDRPAEPTPRVVIVSALTKAGVVRRAGPLVAKGYRPQSVQMSNCEVVGIYDRGGATAAPSPSRSPASR